MEQIFYHISRKASKEQAMAAISKLYDLEADFSIVRGDSYNDSLLTLNTIDGFILSDFYEFLLNNDLEEVIIAQ